MPREELREAAKRAAGAAPPMSAEVRSRLTALLRRRPDRDRSDHRAAG
jgi:hypothetical protein